MEKHHLNRKKRAQRNRIFIYILMVVAVISIVTALMLVILGYRFNKFDGKIEQGGLLQFDSRPAGADVFVGESRLANKTPNKITVSAGTHTIKMTRDGYEDWSKEVTIKPGGIHWLNYARLIPRDREAIAVQQFEQVSSAVVSNSRKLMALIDNPTLPIVSVVDIDAENPKTAQRELPVSSYTRPTEGKTQAFDVEVWDEGNRFILVRHTYDDDKLEWLVVDTRGSEAPVNLTTSLGVAIKGAEFSLASNRILYVLTDQQELRRINLDARTLSGPLVSEVAQFSQFDRSTLTFSTLINATTKKRSIGYLTDTAKAPRIIRSYADEGSAPLHMKITRYYGKTYVVTAYGETLDIQVGDLPSSDATGTSALRQVASLTIPGGVESIGFSPDEQRFVYATGASTVTTYDLELLDMHTASDAVTTGSIRWGDGKHMLSTANNQFEIMDFDGANRHTLFANAVDLPGVLSTNNKYVYGFVANDQGVALSRIKLLID